MAYRSIINSTHHLKTTIGTIKYANTVCFEDGTWLLKVIMGILLAKILGC